MQFTRFIKSSFSLVAALALYACAGKDNIEIVYQSQHCGLDTPSLQKVTDIKQINTLQPRPISLTGEAKPATSPSIEVDLDANYLALVALGQKNTGGYSMNALAEQVIIKDKVLHLPKSIEKPANAMVAQVITTPCAVIALKKSDYQSIHWGDKKLELNNPSGK